MRSLIAIALMVLAPVTASVQAEPVQARHVTVDLLAEQAAVVPGQPLWLLLQFAPQAGWHTYWKNPGDSGLAPTLDWQLPDGWQADPPLYPTPEAIPYGSQMNFGYHGKSGLLIRLTPPATLTGSPVTLALKARWLVCADACVPGAGEFAVQLPVAAAARPDTRTADAFARVRATLPRPLTGSGRFRVENNQVELTIPAAAAAGLPAGPLLVFIAPGQLVEPGTLPRLQRQNGDLQIRLQRHAYFSTAPGRIDVVLRQAGQGWSVPAVLESP